MKDGEIKNALSPAQVSVMRHRVTEPPYFGRYWDVFEEGIYACAACDTRLFSSDEKFDSKTGWPSFKKPLNERDLQFKTEPGPDDKVEVRCKKCKSHLGYVISNDTPYYRINSVCLVLKKSDAPAAISPQKKKGYREEVADTDATSTTLRGSEEEIKNAVSVPSLVVGVMIGLALGSALAALYLSRTQPAAQGPTATTTAATTTVVAEPGLNETSLEPEVSRQVDEPVVSPVETNTAPEVIEQALNEATTTQ